MVRRSRRISDGILRAAPGPGRTVSPPLAVQGMEAQGCAGDTHPQSHPARKKEASMVFLPRLPDSDPRAPGCWLGPVFVPSEEHRLAPSLGPGVPGEECKPSPRPAEPTARWLADRRRIEGFVLGAEEAPGSEGRWVHICGVVCVQDGKAVDTHGSGVTESSV